MLFYLFVLFPTIIDSWSFFPITSFFWKNIGQKFRKPQQQKTYLLTEQTHFDLNWYVIGTSTDYMYNIPYPITIWNKKYVLWKSNDNHFHGLDNTCPHKSASLSCGHIENNNIVCPYHGIHYNTEGVIVSVPGITNIPISSSNSSSIYSIEKYRVLEKNGWIYFNISPNPSEYLFNTFFIEDFPILLKQNKNEHIIFNQFDFDCYARLITENYLDIMHFVSVNPILKTIFTSNLTEISPPKWILDKTNFHARTILELFPKENTYFFKTGEKIVIENEFILPHTTILRIIYNNYTNTIITFALPIQEQKTKLFVKIHRNYCKDIFLCDFIIQKIIMNICLQDINILNNIDFERIDGNFNLKFDKLPNVYRSSYCKLIHNIL
jgi:vanillate O-demethylase monooxygenase subunit